jgi:hypothetical protein
MDSISLKVPVTVKAKLTESLKKQILDGLAGDLKRVELELQQLDIQEKRTIQENTTNEQTPENMHRIQSIQAYFNEERQKRLQFQGQAQQRQEDMQKLALGAEIVQGTLERQVEVHVGDDMREIMNVEVLVEDNKIVAIRG